MEEKRGGEGGPAGEFHQDMVLEFGFWTRSRAVVPTSPELGRLFLAVRRRHGITIANLIFAALRVGGERFALEVGRELLQFSDTAELLDHIARRASLLHPRDRARVMALVMEARMEEMRVRSVELAKEKEGRCPGLSRAAAEVAEELIGKGLVASASCIVELAQIRLGCRAVPTKRCRDYLRLL